MSAPTATQPPNTTPTPASDPPTTSSQGGTPNDDLFDIASVFGDVDVDALAVTSDDRVIAAADTELLVRDPDGATETIELPDDVVVSQAWVGSDEIAVVWGDDAGVEVDLRTGELITRLTRTGDIWARTERSQADDYKINAGRPTNPLGLGLLIDAATRLPEVEGAGGFEVVFDQSQRWTIGRPADGSAFVDEISPLTDGGYLLTMRSIAAEAASPDGVYPYVVYVDGTIEDLGPVDVGEQVVDTQPGPTGLTLLVVDGTTASIEHIPLTETT